LPLKVPPELQTEAEPAEIEVDEGLPQKRREGDDGGTLFSCCRGFHPVPCAALVPLTPSATPLVVAQDSTFEFEKRRNRPIRYNRETMEQTLRAMKKVSEIRHKRQDMFFKMRMRAHKGMQREQIRAEIKKGTEILAPAAADREKAIALATKKIVAKRRAEESKRESKMQN